MSDLTLSQRIQIAGGIARILASHGSDIASLASDAGKAMRIAAEIHGVIDGVTAQSAPKPPAAAVRADSPQTEGKHDQPVEAPDAPWVAPRVGDVVPLDIRPAQKLSATRAAFHVEQNGLSPAERAIFDRASQSSG